MAQNSNILINKTVANLLKNLSSRNKDIISRRFGLKNGKKETLESIGQSYEITRERVRQIEEFILKQLTEFSKNDGEVDRFVSLAQSIINKNGGVIKERELFKAFSGNEKDAAVNSSLILLLSLRNGPMKFSENESFNAFWGLDKARVASFQNTASSLETVLAKNKKPVSETDFYSLIKKYVVSGFDGGELNFSHIGAYLSISKNVGKNIYNEIGLVNWPEIKPRGVKDKAYLILKKANAPKHFGDIAKCINVANFFGKKANTQTVHNELIKDTRFVLVGRGMYALAEWGYKSGTVKDVLIDILKNSSRPVHKTALLTGVMNARMVKENTILLNLQDSKVFVKNEDGTYTLRKA